MTTDIKKTNANAKDTLIIAFIGGPGVGKTTAAFGTAYEFKKRSLSVEYVEEFCNYLFYTEQLMKNLNNQAYIASQQYQKYFDLLGKVDYIITDTGLEICALHARQEDKVAEDLVWYLRSRLNQFTILIERDTDKVKYETESRVENEEESKSFGQKLEDILRENGCQYVKVVGTDEAIKVALEKMEECEKNKM